MSKWEKAKSVYVSISLVCMIIYLAIGAVAGLIYGLRCIQDKLQSRKAKQQLSDQFNDSVENVDDDEVVRNLEAAGWDYV